MPEDKDKKAAQSTESTEEIISEAKKELDTEESEIKAKEAAVESRKVSVAVKIFGVLCILGGISVLPFFAVVGIGFLVAMNDQVSLVPANYSVTSVAIFFAELAFMLALAIMFIVLGIRLLRNKRHGASIQTLVMTALVLLVGLCDIMLNGLTMLLVYYGIIIILLIVLGSYLDPELAAERRLKHKREKLETYEEHKEGTLGRDTTGKGYITLNFFNLFWVFVICCMLGMLVETLYFTFGLGHYENRTGMLWGPFSPIYGLGGVIMTVALNRFHRKNFIIIFLVSAVLGGAFEFAVSWFMQMAFGITAWDYTGTFLSIDGRTNGVMMVAWGLLGLLWLKLFLPIMLRLVNLIPWNWRYVVTSICAALMIFDGAMTLLSLDCWYQREAGIKSNSAVEVFFEKHYGNDFMKDHFQSMTINPSDSARTD